VFAECNVQKGRAMIAWWLRFCLAVGIAAVGGIDALLVSAAGLSPVVATLTAVAVVVGLSAGSVVVKYAISRVHAYKPPTDLDVPIGRVIGAALVEACAFVLVFSVIQPFERWWMGSDTVGRVASARTVVLLVHGYVCNRGLWWLMRRRLRACGIASATVDLEPPLGGIDGFVEQLHARIEALIIETGTDRIVLIAHSMGGLVARAYLRRHGPARVQKLITLATPHHGTQLAYLGAGRNSREMEPDSAWLRELADGERLAVPTLSIWSVRDELVVPQDSARLPGAREAVMPALGHLSTVLSHVVADLVVEELRSPH
jgi:triacylglycerol lipase